MKRIIIAENIKAVLEKERCFLDRSDMKTFTVSSNEQALALHRVEKADLIVVNLDSPEMRAEMLCSLIRDSNELCKVSVIVLSPDTEADAIRRSHCRANAFIVGPLDRTILLREMHQLLWIAPRKSLRVPLSIQINIVSKGVPSIAYSENISVSGMLLYSEVFLLKGDAIICSFFLSDAVHIKANAKIVRILEKETEHDTNYYGIKFMDLSTHYRSAIATFVEKRMQA